MNSSAVARNRLLAEAIDPPVMAARRWMAGKRFSDDKPLLNMSQAAPAEAPAAALREHMAAAIREQAEAHLYGPVLGDDALRTEIAGRWSAAYGAAPAIEPTQVAVTAGCNQAFCAAVAAVAGPGDSVLLTTPWYFNHKMWLDMSGVEAVALPVALDQGCLPSVETARERLDPRVKAIVLVTPNNPTGAEYPPELIAGFYDLAAETGAALIVDETYRDFHSRPGAPHALFQRADWPERLIHLYSFSKAFRLTGHRVGALITGAERLADIEKFLDTVTICPPRLGQIAALYGLREMAAWVAAERAEILARGAALRRAAARLRQGWRVLSAGAYFAYLRHPFDAPSETVAKALLDDQALLCLPGSMFEPAAAGDAADRCLRLAYANTDAAGIDAAVERLAAFDPGALGR